MNHADKHLVGIWAHERETLPRKFPASVVVSFLRGSDTFYTVDFLHANHIGTGITEGKLLTPKQHWHGICCAHALKLPSSKEPTSGAGWAREYIPNKQNLDVH